MRNRLLLPVYFFCAGAFAQAGDMAWMNGAEPVDPAVYELVSFVAEPSAGGGIRLQWSTSAEPPGTRFIVERSRDRMNWRPAFTTDGEGDERGYRGYAFMDLDPAAGLAYYRLSAMAGGHMLEVSDDFAVEYHADPAMRIIGDPVPGRFLVEGAGTITQVQLLNNRGQFMPMELNYGQGSVWARTEGLEPGTYYVQAVVNGFPMMQPVVLTAGGMFGG